MMIIFILTLQFAIIFPYQLFIQHGYYKHCLIFFGDMILSLYLPFILSSSMLLFIVWIIILCINYKNNQLSPTQSFWAFMAWIFAVCLVIYFQISAAQNVKDIIYYLYFVINSAMLLFYYIM